MAKKKKLKNGKVSKIPSTKRNDKGNAKKTKRKKASTALPRNARSNKAKPRGKGKAKKQRVVAYIDSQGRARSVKTGKYVKVSDTQKKRLLYVDGAGRIRDKKTKKYVKVSNEIKDSLKQKKKTLEKKIPIKTIVEEYYTNSIKPELENPIYETTKVTIKNLDGIKTITKNISEAILTVENENDIVWEIVDISREITDIDSPQILIPLIKVVEISTKKGKIKRTINIDYTNINTGSISKELFKEAKRLYGKKY